MALETKEVVDSLVARYFPNVSDTGLRSKLDRLLDYVRTDHRVYADGPLCQALVISYVDPMRVGGDTPAGGSATIRLHLSNGTVHGAYLTGCIEHVFAHLERIAGWLLGRPYDEDAFNAYDQALVKLLDAGQPGSSACQVHLDRYASIAPFPAIGLKMACAMFLAALNALRAEYGLAPEGELSHDAKSHFGLKFSPENVAVMRYLAHLNQPVLAFIRPSRKGDERQYDVLKIYNFFVAKNGDACRNRLQAMHELPWLLPVLTGLHRTDPKLIAGRTVYAGDNPDIAGQIIDAIDAGMPLFDSVARAFGTPRETVRWSRNRVLPRGWRLDARCMEVLLRMLSWLPPEKRPHRDEEWGAMRVLVNMLLAMFVSIQERTELPDVLREARYGLLVRRWLGELMRPDLLSAHRKIVHMQREHNDLASAKDYFRTLLRSLHRFCDHPLSDDLCTSDPYLAFMLDWARMKSLQQILALSRQWHEALHLCAQQAMPHLTRDSATRTEENTWPAVLPQPLRIGTVVISELTDTASLLEEGSSMRHCVGGFSRACSSDSSLIFSVRDEDGRRLSTAELHIHTYPLQVVPGQHRAIQDAAAPSHCHDAINELVCLLNRADHRNFLRRRHAFQQAQRQRQHARKALQADSSEKYDVLAEGAAWASAFGAPPAEHSVRLASLYQRIRCA